MFMVLRFSERNGFERLQKVN